MEVWKQVQGFGGHYEASNLGRVRSKPRTVHKRTRYGGVMQQNYPERILTPYECRGYLRLHIGYDGKKQSVSIHTMVLCAFLRPPKEGEVCRHLDGDRQNNHPSNLKWGTHLENMRDRKEHGRYLEGGDHVMAKFSAEEIQVVRQATDMTGADLSRATGISQSHISRIRKNKTWRECA